MASESTAAVRNQAIESRMKIEARKKFAQTWQPCREYNERCSFSWNVGSKRCHKYLYNNLNRHIQDFWNWSANSDARPGSVECVKRRKKSWRKIAEVFFYSSHFTSFSHREESSIEAIAISDQHCRSDFTSPLLEWNKKNPLEMRENCYFMLNFSLFRIASWINLHISLMPILLPSTFNI